MKESVVWDIVQNKVLPLQKQVELILELERTPEPLARTESTQASSEPQRVIERSGSTDSSTRSIYPPQQERAAVIIPIARSLLEAGRVPYASVPTQQTSPGVEELELKDYKLTLDSPAKTWHKPTYPSPLTR